MINKTQKRVRRKFKHRKGGGLSPLSPGPKTYKTKSKRKSTQKSKQKKKNNYTLHQKVIMKKTIQLYKQQRINPDGTISPKTDNN